MYMLMQRIQLQAVIFRVDRILMEVMVCIQMAIIMAVLLRLTDLGFVIELPMVLGIWRIIVIILMQCVM